jgi:cytochrome c553
MYVSVGSSCNACEEQDERRAALLRFRPDGSQPEVHARGLRNTVGFDWQPGTGELFGTDNGRDLLGDDVPPCELNRIVAGGFYGWPYAYGDKQPDPDFGAANPDRVRESLAPAHGFGAHTAPLGIAFLRGAHWPPPYRGAALVALHGSWNRTEKQGYEVVSLHFGERGTVSERKFLSGLEVDDDVIGRPVDVAEGPDGAIYVSDDLTGRIYRVTLAGVETARAAAGAATPAAAPPAAPLAAMPADEREARAARGAALYSQHFCAQCHEGLRAEEGVIVVPLANLASRYTVPDLMAFLAAPTPPMPALGLSDDERRDLAVHLLSAHP